MFVAVQDPSKKIQHFSLPVCPGKKIRNFPHWYTPARSYSKLFRSGASLVLSKCANSSPWHRKYHSVPRWELLARKESTSDFFDPRNSRHTPNRPNLSCQMVSQEETRRGLLSTKQNICVLIKFSLTLSY